jgi:hypothetical protein
MAEAKSSLSPKALERIRRHRHAVAVLALMRAKKAVQVQIRAKGQCIADFSCKQISLLAEDYLAQHGEQLRAEAEHTIATWPGFTRWRLPANVRTNAQEENEPKSITSAVQMSGAQ